jgi:hypothetical protein
VLIGALVLSVVLAGTSADTATAQVAPCSVTWNRADLSTTTPEHPLEVDAGSVIVVRARGETGAAEPDIRLKYGPIEWPIATAQVSGGVATASIPIDQYSQYGVGLYQVVVTAGGCTGTAWVNVGGRSPFTTVAGVAAAVVLGLGLLLLLWGLFAGGKLGRGFIGGALAGLGALVLSQQLGIFGMTTRGLIVWTGAPGLTGAAINGVLKLAGRAAARAEAPPGEVRAEFPDAGDGSARTEGAARGEAGGAEPPRGYTRAEPTESFDRAELGLPPEPPKPPGRRISAKVYEGGSDIAQEGPLAPLTSHQVAVWIGPSRPGVVSADRELDESLLPKDRQPHTLRIVFQEIGALGMAQTGTIVLPPSGDSDSHRFSFITGSGGTYRARTIVSYRNRVLQTALFEAEVADGRDLGSQPPLRITVETNARPSMTDLDERAAFDLAFVVNHDDAGQGRVTVVHDGAPSTFETGPFEETVTWFEHTLSKLAESPDRYSSLTSDGTVRLLRDLAIRGRDLFTHLLDWRVSDAVLHPKHNRVQLIPGRPNAFFPLEFVYDKSLPSDGASLCANAKEALAAGQCLEACPPGGDQHAVVCPLGFWCLSRVIERQPFLPGKVPSPNESQLLAEPVKGRDSLQLFAGALYAASDRVDAVKQGSVGLVSEALGRALHRDVTPVKRWTEWRQDISTASPTTLVVVCHTEEKRSAGEPVLQFEIGAPDAHEWLGVNEIEREDVLGPGGIPPLVLLIGCSTGVQRVEFQDSVAAFMRSGASIVVSTLATVLGEYAAEVTAALIEELGVLAKDPDMSFGDALLHVRRRMLANDVPMVLSLTAFGDAEWRLAEGGGVG